MKFEERRLGNIDRNLRGDRRLFEPLAISPHWSPILSNFDAQTQLRRTYWDTIPAECKDRTVSTDDICSTYDAAFSIMSGFRLNRVNPEGQRLFAFTPACEVALMALHRLPSVEAALLKCVGRDVTENLFTIPKSIAIGGGKRATILTRDGTWKASIDNGPLEDLPPGGIPLDELWVSTTLSGAQRISAKLALRRRDLVTEVDLSHNIDSLDRSALVSHLRSQNTSYSRFEVNGDQAFLGTVYGFGEDVDDVGSRLPIDQAKWTAPAMKQLCCVRYVAALVQMGIS